MTGKIVINPPPDHGACECCHVARCMVKDFRDIGGCISAYWVCGVCLQLSDEEFWKITGIAWYDNDKYSPVITDAMRARLHEAMLTMYKRQEETPLTVDTVEASWLANGIEIGNEVRELLKAVSRG